MADWIVTLKLRGSLEPNGKFWYQRRGLAGSRPIWVEKGKVYEEKEQNGNMTGPCKGLFIWKVASDGSTLENLSIQFSEKTADGTIRVYANPDENKQFEFILTFTQTYSPPSSVTIELGDP